MIIIRRRTRIMQEAKGVVIIAYLMVCTHDVHAEESCIARFQETLESIQEMRDANMAWYTNAIYSIGTIAASYQLKPKNNVTTQLSTQASDTFYKCLRAERKAGKKSDAERIDKVIDDAQRVSGKFLPTQNDSAFQAGSDVLRDLWKTQFEDLSSAFSSTDNWGSPAYQGISENRASYQSKIFSSDAIIAQNPNISGQHQIDTQSTAYLDQLESVSNALDSITYNEIASRVNETSSRQDFRREKERERYRQEHELLMQRLDAVSSSRTPQPIQRRQETSLQPSSGSRPCIQDGGPANCNAVR